ncbi:MAG: Holliday junction resolvase RuvX [Pseudomonadota bacterium]|nr:Holliday junction resolvase RuvX [Pseudomonadota bacterium]
MPETQSTGTITTVLGFDYGRKRIGVAVGQTLTGSSRALTVLKNDGNPSWQSIQALIQEWSPNALVVGLPLLADGTRGDMAKAAQRFARTLAEKTGLPVTTVDERLTSWEADHAIRESKERADRDAVAASLIVATYLQGRA